MRWSRSGAVQRFIQSALACTCLTLIPFSGCTKNSSRDFSFGLRKEASRSALKAEEELAAQKRRDAAARLLRETEEKAAGTAVVDSGKTRRTSLADFMNDEQPQTRDPFAIAEAENTAGRAAVGSEKSDVQQTAAVTGRNASESSGESPWDQLMRDYLSQDEATQADATAQTAPTAPAGGARPFPRPQVSTAEPKPEAPAIAATQTDVPAWARGLSGSGSKVVGPEPPAEWANADAAESPNEQVQNASADDSDAGVVRLSQEEPTSAPSFAEAATPQAEAKPVPTAQDARLAQKLRIQSLLSQSHSDIVRGNWLSAYRTALLAQQESETHKVVFGEFEERPTQLVNEIATRLWGRPDARPNLNQANVSVAEFSRADRQARESQLASAVAPRNEVVKAEAASVGSVLSSDVFGSAGRTEWVPVSGEEAATPLPAPNETSNSWSNSGEQAAESQFRPQPPAQSGSVPQASSSELPVIRSRDSWRDDRTKSATPEVTKAASVGDVIQTVGLDGPAGETSWANYLSDKDDAVVTASDEKPAVAQEPAPFAGTPDNVVAIEEQAPIAAENEAAPAVETSGYDVTATTTLALSEASTESDGSSNGNMVWAIGGFLAALAATVIGLRSNRQQA
ncbi:MAG: hypothetical protein KDA66_01465 [Planctomycetaceae bacterium]|nr:hypothetical protein [Planctomycetaceae bacterium]